MTSKIPKALIYDCVQPPLSPLGGSAYGVQQGKGGLVESTEPEDRHWSANQGGLGLQRAPL